MDLPGVRTNQVKAPWLALLAALALTATPARAQAQSQTVEYYHLDAVGNVRAVSDEAGQVIERHDYLPFGEEWCGTAVCSQTTAGQPYRFTGKERDPETGLDYFGARYYGSGIGRFTSIDPVYTWQENLVDPQRWNRYTYGRSNPLRYVDPDGKAVLPAAALGAAIGGALGFGGSVFAQYVRNGSFADINYADARAAMYGGAVSGALAGGTLGVSLLAGAGTGTVLAASVGANAAGNVAGGAVTRATDSRADTEAFQGRELAIDAGVGAVGGAVGFGVQRSVVPEITHLTRTRAGMQAAARGGDYGAGSGSRGIGQQIGEITRQAEVGATVAGAQATNQAAPIAREVATKRDTP